MNVTLLQRGPLAERSTPCLGYFGSEPSAHTHGDRHAGNTVFGDVVSDAAVEDLRFVEDIADVHGEAQRRAKLIRGADIHDGALQGVLVAARTGGGERIDEFSHA